MLEAGTRYRICIEYRKTRLFSGMQVGYQYTDGGAAETARCVALARRADVAIVTAGWDNVSEAEGFDRDFSMNPEIERMLLEVAAVQPNTVVVLTAGGNLDMSRWIARVRGVLHAFYPGQAGGQALAAILFGVVNPSGKLPATFEKRAEDRGSFESYFDRDGDERVELSDGIWSGYRHFDRNGIEPRFPFGFGLSYTSFRLSELVLSSERLTAGQSLGVRLRVRNTGKRAGAEVVQVYVRDVASRLPRPPKELKGFARVSLEPRGDQRGVHRAVAERSSITTRNRSAGYWSSASSRSWSASRPPTFVCARARSLPEGALRRSRIVHACVRSDRRERCRPLASKLSGASQVRWARSSSGQSRSMTENHAVSLLRPL
jgi:beta-glucosidase